MSATWDFIAIGAAFVSIGGTIAAIAAAIYAGKQAKHAKKQADSAEHQVELMKKQVDIAQRANELTEKKMTMDREAQQLYLDMHADVTDAGGRLKLKIIIENNSQVQAEIQSLTAYFADGKNVTDCSWSGGIDLTKRHAAESPRLPGSLKPGSSCAAEFQQLIHGNRVPADFSKAEWRDLDRIEIRASNKPFSVPDGKWRQDIRAGRILIN